jgi:Lon protease-like protein
MMIELPLFPLNTVLFPGMPLPLHIFEERYQEMIRQCLSENEPFGVVLIRQGSAEGGPLATPHNIGCTAAITQVEKLDEERLVIMTVGLERFRIVSLETDRPYLVGQVEILPLLEEKAGALRQATDRLYPLVIEYLTILAEVGDIEFDAQQISADAQTLGFTAASIIQIPTDEKQKLLEAEDGLQLMRSLHNIYRREVALMRTMPRQGDIGLFSMN